MRKSFERSESEGVSARWLSVRCRWNHDQERHQVRKMVRIKHVARHNSRKVARCAFCVGSSGRGLGGRDSDTFMHMSTIGTSYDR
jgi:hypothetical protein